MSPDTQPRPHPTQRQTRRGAKPISRRQESEKHRSQVRHVEQPKPQKESKLFNTYIPRFISDTKTGGFFKRYHFERYYIYIVSITICALIYIANTFEVHRLYYREAMLNEQIKDLRAKSLTIASIKMVSTRESAIYNQILERKIPLVYPKTPPLVIKLPQSAEQADK